MAKYLKISHKNFHKKELWRVWRSAYTLKFYQKKMEALYENLHLYEIQSFETLNQSLIKILELMEINYIEIQDFWSKQTIFQNVSQINMIIKDENFLNHNDYGNKNIIPYERDFFKISNENFNANVYGKENKHLMRYEKEFTSFLNSWTKIFRKNFFIQKSKMLIKELKLCKNLEEISMNMIKFLKRNFSDNFEYVFKIIDLKQMKFIFNDGCVKRIKKQEKNLIGLT